MAQKGAEAKILRLLNAQSDAWNNGDLEGFMKGYWKHDSLVFIGKRGPTYGYKATLDNYKKGYPDRTAMGKLRFDILHADRLFSKYYRVIGKWNLERKAGDLDGYFTLILRKVKGEWLIVSDHSS